MENKEFNHKIRAEATWTSLCQNRMQAKWNHFTSKDVLFSIHYIDPFVLENRITKMN